MIMCNHFGLDDVKDSKRRQGFKMADETLPKSRGTSNVDSDINLQLQN